MESWRKREREDQDKPVLFRHNLYCVVRMYDIILTFDPRRCIVLIGQVGPYRLPLYCWSKKESHLSWSTDGCLAVLRVRNFRSTLESSCSWWYTCSLCVFISRQQHRQVINNVINNIWHLLRISLLVHADICTGAIWVKDTGMVTCVYLCKSRSLAIDFDAFYIQLLKQTKIGRLKKCFFDPFN